jgi:hypothetical protein
MTVLTAPGDTTSVSPELALVDPGLAERAREQLPAPPDTLEALALSEPRPLAPPRRRRRWAGRVVTWTAMLGLLAGAGFVVGSRADLETPTATPDRPSMEAQTPAAQPSKPVKEPAARPRTPSPSSGAAAQPRRFAWVPVAGATGYHVELFRGRALIFRRETTRPEILIRRSWRFNGRRQALRPGAYRWYVWPRVNGRRNAEAVVQAELVVSR